MPELSASLAIGDSAESHRNSMRNVTKETIELSRSTAQYGPPIPGHRGRSHRAPGTTLIARHTMDQKLIDARANPRQTNIEAQTEIRELSLNELDHVAGGSLFESCSHGVHYANVTITA